MSDAGHPFYTERVPEQVNRTLAGAREGEAAEAYQALSSVDGTIEARVEGTPGGPVYLNIECGYMTAANEPTHEPFLVLIHDVEACEAIERESGGSALGFLGGIAGLDQELRLTKPRVDNLRQVRGTVRFTLAGPQGFTLCAHFGGGAPAPAPACELVVDGEVYQQLRSGEMDPQDAFMSGKIDIVGDMQMAMQLALAVMSPD